RTTRGLLEYVVDGECTVANADQLRVRTSLLNLGHFAETAQPFLAFFLLDGQTLTANPFAFILQVARPALRIQNTQRGTFFSNREGIVQQQSDGLIALGASRPQAFSHGMRGVVQRGGVLRR